MVVRGKSDHLDHAAMEAFVHSLSNYISTKLSSGGTLWDFGPYGALDANLEKSAPLIDHLLRNEDLWRLCIQVMPMAKMKDCNMAYALRQSMNIVKDGVNNQGISDALFITWCIRSMHVQLSHLRMLRKYPARYAYRVLQEPQENQDRLEALVNTIVLEAEDPALLTPIKTAMGSKETNPPRKVAHAARTSAIADIVPTMFLHNVTKDNAMARDNSDTSHETTTTASHTSSTSDWLQSMIPNMFCSGLGDSATHTALPAKRGAIRGTFKKKQQHSGVSNTNIKSCIENAYTGNIRTTLRVKSEGVKGRPFWAQVTKQQHSQHKQIIMKIAAAVDRGEVESKEQAQEMRDVLMATM